MTTTTSDSSSGAPATGALPPRPDVPATCRIWVATVILLEATARGTLADPHVAGSVPRRRSTDARHLGVLTRGETRILHYLATNLSAPQIAGELYLSVNTVRTHQRHLYAKLGARSRTQAVAQARALGLLAPSPRRR